MRKQVMLNVGAAVLGLVLAAPAPSWAGLCTYFPRLCGGGSSGGGSKVPEIDPGAMRATLALAAGGIVLLFERRRRSR
jgi:hypothetical protein